MTRRSRYAALLASLLVPAVVSAQATPAGTPAEARSTAAEQLTSMRPFVKGTRNISVGVSAAGEYQGRGGAIMFEKGMLSFSPSLHVGVGAFTGLQRNVETFGATKVRFTSVPLLGTANLHLAPIGMPRLDLYGGLSAGFTRTSLDTDATLLTPLIEAGTDFSLGIQGGARYSLSQRTSLIVQLGLGDLPLAFAGGSFKF